jgi:hypothetical protein
MSQPTLVETYPCAPATVRGRGVLLGGHAGKDVILYANGKSIVIRSLAGEGTKLLQWPPPNVHSTRQEPRINYAELYSLLFLCISRHH